MKVFGLDAPPALSSPPCVLARPEHVPLHQPNQTNPTPPGRFPSDVELVQRIVAYLLSKPDKGVTLPTGTFLTPRLLQTLGLAGEACGPAGSAPGHPAGAGARTPLPCHHHHAGHVPRHVMRMARL